MIDKQRNVLRSLAQRRQGDRDDVNTVIKILPKPAGVDEGFRRLVDQVRDLKPSVIVVGYGANESFAGEAGLPAFRTGLARLLRIWRKTCHF